jgi:putative alpha-1,2-mannosidase
LNRPFINHTDIAQGGKLNLVMGDRPNKNWGTKP